MYTETGLTVQTPITHNVNANIGGYLEALPAHYATILTKRYPLIIFLHGQGELGNGSISDLKKVADNAIPKLIADWYFSIKLLQYMTPLFSSLFFHRSLNNGHNLQM